MSSGLPRPERETRSPARVHVAAATHVAEDHLDGLREDPVAMAVSPAPDPEDADVVDATLPIVKGMVADNPDMTYADEAELFDDADWDTGESEDAARLDGATGAELASDFYAEMDDSVVDEYPDEELDD